MNSVLASLLGAQGKGLREAGLVSTKLDVQRPGGGGEAQDGGLLARDPGLVVRGGAGPSGDVEESLAAGRGDVDDGRTRVGGKAGVQQVAELDGVGGGEGCKGEGVLALGLEGFDLRSY